VRIDRATGKPVSGSFPTTEDPKSGVIWEAFQPQTDTVERGRSSMGDPYGPQYLSLWQQAARAAQEPAPDQKAPAQQPRPRPSPPQVATAPEPQPSGLPTQNAL
jgi:penicillin-binding protein 1A